MNTERPLVEGRDWIYTPVTVPASHAQFMNLDQACDKPSGTEPPD